MLSIYSIFNSVSGEVGAMPQGCPMTFIRLAGCNLKCTYCDTKKALRPESGAFMSVDKILGKVNEIGCHNVMITGGEPLLQREGLTELVDKLTAEGHHITVETNGSFQWDMEKVDSWVIDFKLPSSQATGMMRPVKEFMHQIPERSVLKFVCMNWADFDVARAIIREIDNNGTSVPQFALSAAKPLEPAELVQWMQDHKLFHVVLNVQIHKWIWPSGEKEK